MTLRTIATAGSVLLGLSMTTAFATTLREALWGVEQVCIASQAALGQPFPCLDVDLGGGYVVLRDKSDTILAPTIRVAGIEDHRLTSGSLPNYFAQAWSARRLLANKTRRVLAHDDVALAINSQSARSQDQLHIHLDCLAGDVQEALREAEPQVPETGWAKLAAPVRNLDFWARRLPADRLGTMDPFVLVADELPWARRGMGEVTIVLAGSHSTDGKPGFLLLAARTDRLVGHHRPSGEDLLDHRCATRAADNF